MVTVQDFRKWGEKHPNFVTPNVLRVRQIRNYFVELSEGKGFEHDKIYGVSIISWDGKEFTANNPKFEEVQQSFYDKVEAVKYFGEVSKKIRDENR